LSALVPRLLATVLAAAMLFLPAMLLAGMAIRSSPAGGSACDSHRSARADSNVADRLAEFSNYSSTYSSTSLRQGNVQATRSFRRWFAVLKWV
jgi:outer membrane lipoprotein-sorting protein